MGDVATPHTKIHPVPNSILLGQAATFLDTPWPVPVTGFYKEFPFQQKLRYFAIINLGPESLYLRFSAEDDWAWLPPFAGFEHENINPPGNSVFLGAETAKTAFAQLLTVELRD